MSPNASHRVRPGLSSAASLITTLLISFDQEVLNQHLNLVTPEYPFFESPWAVAWLAMTAASPIVYVSALCIRQLRARYYGRSPEYLLRPECEQLLRSAGPQLAAVTSPLPAPRRRAVGMLTCLLARSAPGGFAG